MTDYAELKLAAVAATSGVWVARADGWTIRAYPDARLAGDGIKVVHTCSAHMQGQGTSPDIEQQVANQIYIEQAQPSVVLGLISEIERLDRESQNLSNQLGSCDRERRQLKAENEVARMRIKEMDLLFGRYLLAMRSALIEEEHGKGPAAGMEWIYNSLAGPGELPPEGETDSQAYFDREIVAVDNGMQEVMAFHEKRRTAAIKPT